MIAVHSATVAGLPLPTLVRGINPTVRNWQNRIHRTGAPQSIPFPQIPCAQEVNGSRRRRESSVAIGMQVADTNATLMRQKEVRMKRHLLALGCTLSLMLAGAGYAQVVPVQPDVAALSAGKCQTVTTENEVIAVGPPVLTLRAADCALDFIAFTASELRGGKHMEVDSAMRVNWRGYLATQYVTLAPADRT